MSFLEGLITRAMVLTIGSFYGLLVSLKMLVDIVKFGPAKVFSKKKRIAPPACLEDPGFGTHGYAHLEDIRMHYISNGSEEKPLMLLVHGFPEFWYSWRHQLKEFKDNYRVVAVDLRGYGDSDKPSGKGSYTVPRLVNDLKQLVIALGYKNCVLVGHDWGGALSWAFAEMFPDMVSRLVILNCPNGWAMQKHLRKSFSQFKMSWYMFLFQLPWLPELLLSSRDLGSMDMLMQGSTGGVKSSVITADDIEAYKYTFSRNGFTGPINFYRAAFSLASLSQNQEKVELSGRRGIIMPTLIIWGDKDVALEKDLAQLSSQLCKDKVVIKHIEDSSHWVQMDQPDLVNKYMREFLAED